MITLASYGFTRISATHYQYTSTSRGRVGKVYDLIYHEDLQRWMCNCGDSVSNKNEACTHRRELVLIIELLQMQDTANAQATTIAEQVEPVEAEEVELRELLNKHFDVLFQYANSIRQSGNYKNRVVEARLNERIENVETEQALAEDRMMQKIKSLEEELQAERKAHVETCCKLDRALGAEIEKRIAMQETMERLEHAIVTMEAINTQLVHELEEMHAQVASIQPIVIATPAITIDAPVKRTHTDKSQQEASKEGTAITEIYENGELAWCEVQGHRVKVVRGIAMWCKCSKAMHKKCEHLTAAEEYLESK